MHSTTNVSGADARTLHATVHSRNRNREPEDSTPPPPARRRHDRKLAGGKRSAASGTRTQQIPDPGGVGECGNRPAGSWFLGLGHCLVLGPWSLVLAPARSMVRGCPG